MSNAAALAGAAKTKKRRSRHPHHSHDGLSKAPVVQFARVTGRPEMARLQLLLINLDEKALRFKVKIKQGCTVTALPSGVGKLDGRSSTRVLLIWRRPADIDDWSKVKPATLLVVGEYGDDDNPESKRRIVQRMNGQVSQDKECDLGNPPEERFYFGGVSTPEKGVEATPAATLTPEVETSPLATAVTAVEPNQPVVKPAKEVPPVPTSATVIDQQHLLQQNTIIILATSICILLICILLSTRSSSEK
uniref:Major sperm protein n=1 Tax=Ascaris lumbricoides TaxID=6252 RepID=A0A0M3HW25_ASCLU